MPNSNTLPARYRRPPREYQRVWRGHNVDKQLEDSWLEAFNSLNIYRLVSICTGHPDRNGSTNPHLNFKLKSEWFSSDLEAFERLLERLQLSLADLFEQHGCVNMEYRKTYSADRSRLHDIRQELAIHIRPRIRRNRADFDDTTREWFNNMVLAMKEFDSQSHQILEGSRTHGVLQAEIHK